MAKLSALLYLCCYHVAGFTGLVLVDIVSTATHVTLLSDTPTFVAIHIFKRNQDANICVFANIVGIQGNRIFKILYPWKVVYLLSGGPTAQASKWFNCWACFTVSIHTAWNSPMHIQNSIIYACFGIHMLETQQRVETLLMQKPNHPWFIFSGSI